MITVSVVSHGHGAMVQRLVKQLLACQEVGQVIVTYNILEAFQPFYDDRVEQRINPSPIGFGANHNAAFLLAKESFWCVINPDIELVENPFPALLQALSESSVGLSAPRIMSPAGHLEDSIRRFPTPASLLQKLAGQDGGQYQVSEDSVALFPDWVAGMFMLFRAEAFAAVNGFDEGYFLYYEDVDICVRLWKAGLKIQVCPSVSAIHDARRASRVNWRHKRWHISSMLRFLLKYFGRLPQTNKNSEG